VASIPTLLLIKGGKEQVRTVGLMSKASLKEKISPHL
jgi:hypothetical protein